MSYYVLRLYEQMLEVLCFGNSGLYSDAMFLDLKESLRFSQCFPDDYKVSPIFESNNMCT